MTRAAALFALFTMIVAPDIEQRLSRFKRVEMPFSFEGFSARERTLINELIAASRDLAERSPCRLAALSMRAA